jgi:hypothetical protein
MSSPENFVLTRTQTLLAEMAAENAFTPSQNERVRQVHPSGVRIWRVREGHSANRTPGGISNLPLPAVLITPLAAEYRGVGMSCADDEAVTVLIQILENAPQSAMTSFSTYSAWMEKIRARLLKVPNPFLQDAVSGQYDPYLVHVLQRTSSDAQALVQSEQNMAAMVFQVMVRHYR